MKCSLQIGQFLSDFYCIHISTKLDLQLVTISPARWQHKLLHRPGRNFTKTTEHIELRWLLAVSKSIAAKSCITYPPYTCSTCSLPFLQSPYVAIAARVLQGLHHSIAVPVGSRMSGGHAIQRCCIHLFAQSLVATHAEEGRAGS